MANIETVTEYRFTKPNGDRVNVRVLYDNDKSIVTHEYDDGDIENAEMPGQWWLDALSLRSRDDLHKNNRHLFDFLTARLA